MHFDSQLKKVVQALALCLGFCNIVAPDVASDRQNLAYKVVRWDDSHAMSSYQNGIRVGVLFHCLLQASSQVFFESCVLNDRYAKGVMEAKHSWFVSTLRNAFDLFNVTDLEKCIFATLLLNEKSDEHGPLRMSMNATSGSSIKG